MTYLTLPDLRLYYETHGSGPPLVLLHGLGSSADDWLLQVPVLSQRYFTVAVDLRGHGRSRRAGDRGSFTIAQMADDVAALLEQLGQPPALVMGLSLGGCVAQALAVRHPQKVRALV